MTRKESNSCGSSETVSLGLVKDMTLGVLSVGLSRQSTRSVAEAVDLVTRHGWIRVSTDSVVLIDYLYLGTTGPLSVSVGSVV